MCTDMLSLIYNPKKMGGSQTPIFGTLCLPTAAHCATVPTGTATFFTSRTGAAARRGAELAAPDSPGLFIWPLGRRKPVEGPWWHPRGPVRAPAGGRAGSARFFCQFSWKTLTGALRCSRVPHGYPSAPSRAPQRSRAICTTPGACRPGSVWCKNCPCGPLTAAWNPRELV